MPKKLARGPLVYDRTVERHGLSMSHVAMLNAVPRDSRVLDVGCASGYLSSELQTRRSCTVTGLDYDARAVATARSRGLDAHQIDLEAEQFDATGFDVVVFGDILEHLRDPVAVLRQARPAPLVVVSLPNIGHWTARRQILLGRFPREDMGIFDRTHLRWFTRAAAHELAENAGFAVHEERFTSSRLPLDEKFKLVQRLRQPAATLWPELFAFQFVLSLHPA